MDNTGTSVAPRIQIIEPDGEFRETLAVYLRTCGYCVDTCDNLEDGLFQAQEAGFDLILVENTLYRIGDLDILPTLQAHSSNPCILFMSENPSTTLVRNALREGAFDFLIKPLEFAQIEKSVAAGLENRKTFLEVYHLSRDLQEANQQLQDANRQMSEQKRLLEIERDHLREWARELKVLNEFSRAICSTLDAQEIVAIVASELSTLIRYDLRTLIIFQAAQVQMYFHALLPITHRLVEKAMDDFMTLSPSLLGRQAHSAEIVYQVEGRLGFRAALEGVNIFTPSSTNMAAHLVVAKETIGLISLCRFSGEPFEASQVRLVSTLANQVALALHNAHEYRKTQELSLRDGLTHLYNHAAFQNFLEREFAIFRRYNRPVSLIMFDLDHFKMINDTYGHQTGDYILQELAALSSACVRKTDIFARYGGEEFALLLPDTDIQQAQILASRLRQSVQEHHFNHRKAAIRVTISLGVAGTGAAEVHSKEDLVRCADLALYRAKRSGRNHVCVAHGAQDAGAEPEHVVPSSTVAMASQ